MNANNETKSFGKHEFEFHIGNKIITFEKNRNNKPENTPTRWEQTHKQQYIEKRTNMM